MTHQDFWERYFYKVYQLQEDEKRKADLKNRADKLKQDDSEQAWEGKTIFVLFSSVVYYYAIQQHYKSALLPISLHSFGVLCLVLLLFNSSCCKAPWDEFFVIYFM